MARTKGSKNKNVPRGVEPKIITTVEEPKQIEPIKEVKPKGHPVYVPQPDMGDIKPPPEAKKVCQCGHENEFHYGGEYGHCNRPGCECQKFN